MSSEALEASLCLTDKEVTCDVEAGGHFAVCQRKPDESQAHAEGRRHVSHIIAFTWNTNPGQ